MNTNDVRDMLIDEQNPTALADAVRGLLEAGWRPERVLAEVPTVPEALVRRALARAGPATPARARPRITFLSP